VGREWGDIGRWAIAAFAAVWPLTVFSAAYPFALGFAFALLAIATLQRGSRPWFGVLAALSLAASPLAFVFLAVAVAAAAVKGRSTRGLVPASIVSGMVVLELLLRRLFPDEGRFPFPTREFLAVSAFCIVGAVLTVRVSRARTLHALFLVYLAACAVAFAIPSALGENVARLRFVAIPMALLTLSLRHWRPLAVALPALALAASWNFTPLAASIVSGHDDPTAEAAYWQPVADFLHSRPGPPYRVEVVDTPNHWGAAFLPQQGIPVARGWFRQDDFPQNRILYGSYDRAAYLGWLRRLAVRYVVLTKGPTDYSAKREAQLLRSGRSGLRVAWRTPTVTVYAVPRPRALVVGPHSAAVVSLDPTKALLRLDGPGTYRVALRSSPYWRTSRGCLSATSDGMLRLTVRKAGRVQLRVALTRNGLLNALEGERASCAT
jgi:hypothetical protein